MYDGKKTKSIDFKYSIVSVALSPIQVVSIPVVLRKLFSIGKGGGKIGVCYKKLCLSLRMLNKYTNIKLTYK